jgi:hypothetical protein
LGPDSARYLIAGEGLPVARPFHLRWLLPAVCRDRPSRWRAVWLASWPIAAFGCAWWAAGMVDGWQVPLAAAALLVALPGVWGPSVARPIGVDMPALAVGLIAAALWVHGLDVPAVIVAALAATMKETSPVWVALWCWSPWPLLALAAPAIAAIVRRPAIDEVTAHPNLIRVHDHPVRSAMEHRRGRWRDAWTMVAPWGATLAALVAPDRQTIATLAVAHAQLLVATDTVRLLATTAGPVMALAAAETYPAAWLPLIVAAHAVWWRKPELV